MRSSLEMIVKSGAGEQVLGVATMAGTFADDDGGGACPAKGDALRRSPRAGWC